jgi:hypothetical protein
MFLNGPEVRHRAAEFAPAGDDSPADSARRAQRHLAWLSDQSGIPVGTLHNATRGHNPQTISLPRVYDLAAVLRRDSEDIRDTVAAIVSAADDKPADKPEEKKADRPRDPSGPPPRRNGKDNQRGPQRADTDLQAAS